MNQQGAPFPFITIALEFYGETAVAAAVVKVNVKPRALNTY